MIDKPMNDQEVLNVKPYMQYVIPTHRDYYSIEQTAKVLQVSRQAIRRKILSGAMRAYRIGKDIIIIPKNQFVKV